MGLRADSESNRRVLATKAFGLVAVSAAIACTPAPAPEAPPAPVPSLPFTTSAPPAPSLVPAPSSAPSAPATVTEEPPPPPEPPVTSRDGTRIAFSRSKSATKHASLYLADAKTHAEVELADVGSMSPKNLPKENGPGFDDSAGIYGIQFAPDGRHVFFMTEGWGTSYALFAVDVDTKDVTFIHDAVGFSVIDQCKDRSKLGDLLVVSHSYAIVFASAIDWLALYDAAGKKLGELGPAGGDDDHGGRFLAKTCGVGKAPPPPKPVPPRLRKKVVCRDDAMFYKSIPLLDGTTYDMFLVDMGGKGDASPPEEAQSLTLEEAQLFAACPPPQ